jgi:hypothetical protein
VVDEGAGALTIHNSGWFAACGRGTLHGAPSSLEWPDVPNYLVLFCGVVCVGVTLAGPTQAQLPDDDIKLGESPGAKALVVHIRAPRDAKYTALAEMWNKAIDRGATGWTVRAAKDGEPISAEVVAQPTTHSNRIAAVVQSLLESGITKISVEVRK